MPRPARRAVPAAQTDGEATNTPTRNPITAAIPPFMLDTPDRAPFIDTQQPTHNANESIIPTTETNTNVANRNEVLLSQDVHTHGDNAAPDGSQASTHALTAPSEVGEQSYLSSVQQEADDARATAGLRDLSSLATWTLSSAKPGCGLAQLRSPDLRLFWQSDGPQPHTISLHFSRLVSIVKMRIYLNYELDESYTPIDIKFYAGMSEGALVEFGHWACVEETDPETGETRSSIEDVKGWIEIDLKGVGGRHKPADDSMTDNQEETRVPGDVLKAMVVQVRVLSNFQNGKDTHVRGFQVFATDESAARGGAKMLPRRKKNPAGTADSDLKNHGDANAVRLADWMGEPEIR